MMPRNLNRSDSKKEKFSLKGLPKLINDFKEVIALVLPLLKPSFNIIFITYGFTVFQSILNSQTPKFTGGIIDIVTRSTSENDLMYHLIKMFVFSISINEIQKFGRKINDKARLQINKNLRGEVYRRVLDCDMDFFDEVSTSEATQIINSGVEAALRLTLSQATNMMQIVIGIVTNLYFMYQICPDLVSLVIFLTPLKFSLVFFNVKRRARFTGPMRELYNMIWQLPLQAIQNIGIVKCFSTEDKEHQEYMDAQQKLYDMESKIKDDRAWIEFFSSLMNEGLKVTLFYFGGVRVFKGQMSVGELSTFSMYALGFMSTGASIKNAVEEIFSEAGNSGQLLTILKRSKNTKLNNVESVSKEDIKGTISVNNVSFCYPSKPEVEVLHNINFQMREGESVAFVGISGSGKTTMAYLLQNLYTPTQGRIQIGGKDIREFDIRHLHTQMGYVPQEPVLFDKTIEKNITYGLHREYTEEELSRAITLSNSQFVWSKGKFPQGVETKIGSGPDQTKLSGGQKQRIAIARAFVKNPKLLILDEPTSALDGESESQVQQAIDDLVNLGDRTVVVIAHRLSTIIKCQRIVVFDNGRIVEQGTHKELIELDGTYKRLFNFQLESLKQNM